MSNKTNHRRQEVRRTEHGPRYESSNPGKGCNSTHVAKGRKKYKKRIRRAKRRRSKKTERAETLSSSAPD